MFSNGANFSNMLEKPVKVGKILQKTYISVDENGTEAAGVTREF